MLLHQNWHATKLESVKPMNSLQDKQQHQQQSQQQ
jgi:hypothetical protein